MIIRCSKQQPRVSVKGSLSGATKTALSRRCSNGSKALSLPGSTTLLVLAAVLRQSLAEWSPPPRKRWHSVAVGWNSTSARFRTAAPMSDSHAITMHSFSRKLAKVDVANGPTASACYVGRWAPAFGGCGTRRIMFGQKCTQYIGEDGYTSMPAKELSISRCYITKVRNHFQTFAVVAANSVSSGWNKKMAYCIAFSRDGATDVTRRYCRNSVRYGLERNKCSESCLLYILGEIRRDRRKTMPKDERFELEKQDTQERDELHGYQVATITSEVANLRPTKYRTPSEEADANKARERQVEQYRSRQSGNPDWVRRRREDGRREDGRNDNDEGAR